MISTDCLDAIKALVRLVLQRERECLEHGAPRTTAAPAELRIQLDALAGPALKAAIRRHRLASLLHADPLVAQLLPRLGGWIKAQARSEALAALAMASLTREMADLFSQAGLPMLVLKGVPLSLQTTGTLTARGRGDLDLLVDPGRVAEAIALLQRAGFSLPYGATCVGDGTPQGAYARFVSIELSLLRSQGHQKQWIDLHWHASHVRGVLPRFPQLWEQRAACEINGQQISTLPLSIAFVHACCHAMADNWMCLRNLVDVERLSRKLSPSDLHRAGRLRPVRQTCVVAFELTGAWPLRGLAAAAGGSQQRKALKQSRQAQRLPWRSLGVNGWTLASRIAYALRLINLSDHPSHLLSMALQQAILPVDLMDARTGRYRSVSEVIGFKAMKLRRRISGLDASSPPLPGC